MSEAQAAVAEAGTAGLSPAAAVEALSALYADTTAALRAAIEAFLVEGRVPVGADGAPRRFTYPALTVSYLPDGPPPPLSRAFGKFSEAGVYETTITRPALFSDYLLDQLTLLARDYPVTISVGPSAVEIPYPYVLDGGDAVMLDGADPQTLGRVFKAPELYAIGDELADGVWFQDPGRPRPLSLFDAPRTDFSLQRLAHYTGTPAAAFQNFILFTNYHRYVDEFTRFAVEAARRDGRYTGLVAPGGPVDLGAADPVAAVGAGPWRRFQMPAYHLTAPDRDGITLVNIGVGPSNAKTITDHLAVMRPQCWIMVGHCGGLRHSQKLGDYVLAHAYLRRDRVLDEIVPLDVPIPPIAEIQVALQDAAARVTGESREDLKRRLRTGTVVTDADRNWELRASVEARRFNQSRAIAIDMESATIAAQGFRFRVPYGTLLCVSDKPLHGEIKLPGAANLFYQTAVAQHLEIGIETLEMLKRDDAAALHSRKLRAFDEPPFR